MTYIDTHKAIKELMEKGFSENAAETQVYFICNSIKDSTSDLVTKKDLDVLGETLETRLGARIDTLRALGWAIFVAVGLQTLQQYLSWFCKFGN